MKDGAGVVRNEAVMAIVRNSPGVTEKAVTYVDYEILIWNFFL
jgi:hypothetical protein